MLKSERTFPPGGWVTFLPQTGFYTSPGFTFDQTIDELMQHVQKNPRIAHQYPGDREGWRWWMHNYHSLRLANNPVYVDPVLDEFVKKNSLNQVATSRPPLPLRAPTPNRSSLGAVAAARSKNALVGLGVVTDWLGPSLQPVASSLAERRATICASCPQNQQPDWLQTLEGYAAESVRQLMEVKHDMSLRTSSDNQLHHCQACDCYLQFKVWTELEYARQRTQHAREKLDPRCWLLHEGT